MSMNGNKNGYDVRNVNEDIDKNMNGFRCEFDLSYCCFFWLSIGVVVRLPSRTRKLSGLSPAWG